MLELYHSHTSVCAQKARLALAEKQVKWSSRLLALDGDQYTPAYLALNPNGVVPTLVHDGEAIIESSIIAHYVDDAFDGPSLMPDHPSGRDQVHSYNRFVDEHLHNACIVYTFATVHRAPLAALPETDREALFARSPVTSMSDAKRAGVLHGLDSPQARNATRIFVSLLERMEQSLGRHPWLAGQGFSLADVAVIPYLNRLEMLGLARFWEPRPAVADWWERAQARPSFRTAVTDWLRPGDIERYDRLPDYWPEAAGLVAELTAG